MNLDEPSLGTKMLMMNSALCVQHAGAAGRQGEWGPTDGGSGRRRAADCCDHRRLAQATAESERPERLARLGHHPIRLLRRLPRLYATRPKILVLQYE